jgi:hypothetical protein
MLRILSDIVLIECYLDSLELELDHDFIEMLCNEMKGRNLEIPSVDNQPSTYSDSDGTASFHSNL